MLLESIFDLFFDFTLWLIELLPTVVLFDNVIPSLDALIGVLNNVDCFVPITTVFYGLMTWIVLANFDLVMSILNWFIKKIPGVN